jgi:hypothetical protein
MQIRGASGTIHNSTWGDWITILGSNNYTEYVYSKN